MGALSRTRDVENTVRVIRTAYRFCENSEWSLPAIMFVLQTSL